VTSESAINDLETLCCAVTWFVVLDRLGGGDSCPVVGFDREF
jgi:hypothetical protein